jgi:hypothetical protein
MRQSPPGQTVLESRLNVELLVLIQLKLQSLDRFLKQYIKV